MKLHLPKSLNSSPKQRVIQEQFLAFIQHDYPRLYKHLTDDIIWEFVGIQKLSGKGEIQRFLEQNRIGQVQEISIDYILIQEKTGTVGGKIILSSEVFHFADFYEFVSTSSKKINKIQSFVIKDTLLIP